jgi:hypothetical protein
LQYFYVVKARKSSFQGGPLTMMLPASRKPVLSPVNGTPVMLNVDDPIPSEPLNYAQFVALEIARAAAFAGASSARLCALCGEA